LADQTSSSLSSDAIATPRKMASGNSSKNLSTIATVGTKVMALLTHYSCLVDQTSSSPSSDSIATARKMAFEKT